MEALTHVYEEKYTLPNWLGLYVYVSKSIELVAYDCKEILICSVHGVFSDTLETDTDTLVIK